MFPYKIEPVGGPLKERLLEDFQGLEEGLCQTGDEKWFLPAGYQKHAQQYYNFKPREDDIWIVTFPRSGTTLTQELIWLVNNKLNYKQASEIPLTVRFPYIEYHLNWCTQFKEKILRINAGNEEAIKAIEKQSMPGYIACEQMQSPRHIKSHLPLCLLPPNLLDVSKVVYVARNPKDAAVSFFHHNQLFRANGFTKDFPTYWDHFENGRIKYAPYWNHVIGGWKNKEHPNLLFLFYEDLVTDMKTCIKKVATFLNKTLTESETEELANYLQFDNFKKLPLLKAVKIEGVINPNAQGFVRRGKIGGNEEFTEELEKRADKWVQQNLSKTDLRFPEK